jgi:hypothetical protein
MSGAERQRRYMAKLLASKPSADLAAAKREIAALKARIAELLERNAAKAARARPGKLPR